MSKTETKPAKRQLHLEAMQRASRRRLVVLEEREKARALALAVSDGVEETTRLMGAMGTAFIVPGRKPGEPEKPLRRMSGLVWLRTREPVRISEAQMAWGARWGSLWRAATGETSMRSCLNDSVGGGSARTVQQEIDAAEHKQKAAEKLAEINLILLNQASMLAALADVCGREMTPREATANGRDALRIECLVCVALDMLAEAATLRPQERT